MTPTTLIYLHVHHTRVHRIKTPPLSLRLLPLVLALSACAAQESTFARQPIRIPQATTPVTPSKITVTSTPPESVTRTFQSQKLDCYQVKPTCEYLYSSDPGDTNLRFETADHQVAFEATLEYGADHETSDMEIRFSDKTSGSTEFKNYTFGDSITVMGSIENFSGSDGTVYSVVCSGSHLETGASFRMNRPVSCAHQ
jgi:hypothetical protein